MCMMLFTVLTGRHIEHSVWCAWWSVWTEANIVCVIFNRCEYLFGWCESIAGHIVACGDFLFE